MPQLNTMMTDDLVQDIHSGRVTQKAVAERLGVSQNDISRYIRKHYPDKAVGRGGVYDTPPEVLAAVQECIDNPRLSLASVAERHGVNYLALQRRVKKHKNAAEKAALLAVEESQAAYQEALRDALTDEMVKNISQRGPTPLPWYPVSPARPPEALTDANVAQALVRVERLRRELAVAERVLSLEMELAAGVNHPTAQ